MLRLQIDETEMHSAAPNLTIPTTRYQHIDAALNDVAAMDWTPVDDTELDRIRKAHANALKSAEIEDSHQEPDEIALFEALDTMRCPADIRIEAAQLMISYYRSFKRA